MSSAQNTPIIDASSSSMKIENSLIFLSMLSHDDSSASGVRKPVSTSSIRLRPSMPT